MNARLLNRACMDACDECPQHRGFDDDQSELHNGRYIDVATLHTKGIAAVIKYWRDPTTIGGALLWEHGYYQALDPEIQQLFEKVDTIVDNAIKEALT